MITIDEICPDEFAVVQQAACEFVFVDLTVRPLVELSGARFSGHRLTDDYRNRNRLRSRHPNVPTTLSSDAYIIRRRTYGTSGCRFLLDRVTRVVWRATGDKNVMLGQRAPRRPRDRKNDYCARRVCENVPVWLTRNVNFGPHTSRLPDC